MLIAAPWLLPVVTPPLKDGAVWIEKDAIREIGSRRWFAKRDVGDVIDLPETILLPGFVNTHCHLEHSALRGAIPPRTSFSSWVRLLQEKSLQITESHREEAIQQAIQELVRGGTTTLVDHRSPSQSPWETPFREFTILEVLGATEGRARESEQQATATLADAGDAAIETSAHSLYAVHAKILEKISLRSVHLLESEEEERFFRAADGPLTELVVERGGMIPFPEKSPVRWLRDRGHLERPLLIVHGNYLNSEEIGLLRRSEAAVIHCPGSWRFFGHRRLPIQSLFYNEIPIVIGTDSWASNESLNMLQQLKWMKETYPSLGEEDLLKMATFNGAQALGWGHEVGLIEAGKKADLIGIPISDKNLDPYEALLMAEEVSFSMVGGQVILPLS